MKILEEEVDKVLKETGEKIKAKRIEKGYPTIKSFTEKHNLSEEDQIKIEKGIDYNKNHAFHFAKVLKALDTNWEEFFDVKNSNF